MCVLPIRNMREEIVNENLIYKSFNNAFQCLLHSHCAMYMCIIRIYHFSSISYAFAHAKRDNAPYLPTAIFHCNYMRKMKVNNIHISPAENSAAIHLPRHREKPSLTNPANDMANVRVFDWHMAHMR